MNFYNKIVFSYWRGGIDAAASLYCVFPARDLGYKQTSLASSAKQNTFCNISSCKCASTHNCLYYKSHPFRSGLLMMFVCIARDSGGMGDCCYDAQSVKEL